MTTEVIGLLPQGWTMTLLGDVLKFQPGFPFESTYFSPPGVGVRLIKNRDLRSDDSMVGYVGPIPAGYEVHNGDVLVGMDGDFEPILWMKGNSLLNQRVGRIVPSASVDSRWIAFALVRPLKDLEQGTGATTVKHLSHRDVEDLVIGVPELREQRAIAAALTDAAAWVESLDALIAKKRDMFAGTAQSLLTGRRRLPEFTSAWTMKKFGECLTIRHGRSQAEVVSEGGPYPILATGGEIGRASSFLYNKPSVLIGRKGTIDRPQFMDQPFWTVDTLFYSEVHSGYSAKFLYYKFTMVDWRSFNEASGVPSLNAATIERIETDFPSLDEQQAIANVLTDLDVEIDALVAERDKAELIRQGMAQDLLSGKVRLV